MNIPIPRRGLSARNVVRGAALLSALPVAFFGYFTVPVAAATPMCDGHSATMTVTSHSSHRVHGNVAS